LSPPPAFQLKASITSTGRRDYSPSSPAPDQPKSLLPAAPVFTRLSEGLRRCGLVYRGEARLEGKRVSSVQENRELPFEFFPTGNFFTGPPESWAGPSAIAPMPTRILAPEVPWIREKAPRNLSPPPPAKHRPTARWENLDEQRDQFPRPRNSWGCHCPPGSVDTTAVAFAKSLSPPPQSFFEGAGCPLLQRDFLWKAKLAKGGMSHKSVLERTSAGPQAPAACFSCVRQTVERPTFNLPRPLQQSPCCRRACPPAITLNSDRNRKERTPPKQFKVPKKGPEDRDRGGVLGGNRKTSLSVLPVVARPRPSGPPVYRRFRDLKPTLLPYDGGRRRKHRLLA